MLTISKDMGEFSASHTLTQHEGGCGNLHGHNYRVEVTLIGNFQNAVEGNSESGMIIDFTALKDLYKKHVHEVLDHATIIAKNKPLWYTEFVNLMLLNMRDDAQNPASIAYSDAERNVDVLLGKVAHLLIPETTAEHFSKWILETLAGALQNYVATLPLANRTDPGSDNPLPSEIMVYSVSVWETATSKATYVNPILSPGLTQRFGG